ncbi:methyl-accepting chemotaxis protein [Azospirillum sp. TSO22-1]|uniref:HAMP domain-containing methyl-accepting chemotaxis protein n=1 Tax=Azospirillum sp. TSO22-1 TaxID=716789 RepID=UPI0011B387A4|nr:methyl-accepting chemotaxis protein [Azospirillum sp. TSO22-1]
MTIKTKLRLAFGILIGLFVAFGVGVLQVLSAVSADSDLVAKDVLLGIQATYAIDVASSDYRGAEMMHVLSHDDGDMQALEQTMARLKDDIAHWRKRYEPLVDTPEERRYYDAFARDYTAYLASSAKMLDLSRRNETAGATALLRETGALFQEFSTDLEELVRLAAAHAAEANRASATLIGDSRTLILAGMALVLLFGGACLWGVDRGIGQPVAAMTGTLTQLAAGDFSRIEAGTDRADDLGRMARAVEATGMAVRALATDLGELVDAAHAGALSTRVEAIGHTGEYAVLVKGMNELIEGLTRPLFEVVEVMQLLAAGDLRGRMEGAYEGDLRALKANMNRSLDALVSLLHELGSVTAAMAQGNLTRAVGGSYQGDFAVLKGHINQAIEQLRGLIGSVAEDTQQIAVAITQTSAAARQVAEESSRSLTTLNGVAASIGETAASVDTIAGSAARGSELAARTSAFADEGRARLVHLAGSVERIAATHGRIEQITGKITRISDKTHILSLNAGIEAARAGEEGMGFAIVAQQIGRLAEEAALAAHDIEQIIAESALVVREGVGTTAEARTAIERIAEAAHDSGATVQAMSAAITQQSAAVKDLHERVSALRQGSQANAAAAEEISATMEELARMVHRAREQVGRFVLTQSAQTEPRAQWQPLTLESSASS